MNLIEEESVKKIMKVEFRDRTIGRLLLECDMDVIPREGEKIVIKGHGEMTVVKVWWWINSPSDNYVKIYVKQDSKFEKLKNLGGEK